MVKGTLALSARKSMCFYISLLLYYIFHLLFAQKMGLKGHTWIEKIKISTTHSTKKCKLPAQESERVGQCIFLTFRSS